MALEVSDGILGVVHQKSPEHRGGVGGGNVDRWEILKSSEKAEEGSEKKKCIISENRRAFVNRWLLEI